MKSISMSEILPRTPLRLKNIEIDYPPKFFRIPLKLVFAKDLKKYIIVDGHHRYYKAKELNKKTLRFNLFGVQTKTIRYKDDLPQIEFGDLIDRP